MSDMPNDYGLLINKDIKLHRLYFQQMVKLLGINCQFRALRKGSNWDEHGDLEGKYMPPVTVGCIFNDHPDQKTVKKLGWTAELQENASIIHVPYDLEGLEMGALFTIPSGLDQGKGRVFRVIAMQTSMVYPASIACELAPEYQDTEPLTSTENFKNTNFNVLVDYSEDD